MVVSSLGFLFAFCGACSGYREILMNTEKITKKNLLCTSKGLLQHMQLSQHQPSDDPAV